MKQSLVWTSRKKSIPQDHPQTITTVSTLTQDKKNGNLNNTDIERKIQEVETNSQVTQKATREELMKELRVMHSKIDEQTKTLTSLPCPMKMLCWKSWSSQSLKANKSLINMQVSPPLMNEPSQHQTMSRNSNNALSITQKK